MILLLFACAGDFVDASRSARPAAAPADPQAILLVQPTTLGVVDTPVADLHGTPIGVACATCHGGPDPIASRDGEPATFHTGVELAHGATATCDSCHTADRLALHLSDGTRVELPDVVVLCAQCHGPQWRDFQHGAHGGMNGYWDLGRGQRTRNSCVVCHPAHAPKIPSVQPAPPPRDRFADEAPHG